VSVLIGLVTLNVLVLIWGYALLAAAGRSVSLLDGGLAFCAGLGGLSLAACLTAIAGHVPGWVAVSAATLPIAVWLGWANRATWAHRTIRSRRPTPPRAEGLAAMLVGLVASGYSVLLVRDAYVRPLAEWDAWAIWTVKAKALVTFGHIGAVSAVGAEPAYPPLVPMLQSLVFRFVGSPNSQVVHVEYALLVVAFAAAMWRLLAERASHLVGAVAALAVLMLPAFRRNVPEALADVPLAVFAALAAFFLAAWIADRRGGSLVLFAAFGAFAGWTKNEGTMLVAVLGLIAMGASVSRRPRTTLLPMVATAVALGATAPWRLWTAVHDLHVDTPLSEGLHLTYLRGRFSRADTIALDFWNHIGNAHAWFSAPYLLVALSVLVFTKSSRRLALFSVGVPAAAFGAFVWAYMIRNDPLGVRWLLDTSSSRTTLSIGLIAFVLAFFELTTLLDSQSGGPRKDGDDRQRARRDESDPNRPGEPEIAVARMQ
jgi:hypothetical protein